MMVGHQELGIVTGKPVSIGGSVAREEATGRGVMNVLRAFLKTKSGEALTETWLFQHFPEQKKA